MLNRKTMIALLVGVGIAAGCGGTTNGQSMDDGDRLAAEVQS